MDLEQLEALALAPDRGEALAQLIPGTEEYYYHHCLELLHHLEPANPSARAQLDALLDAWVKRHGETSLVQSVRDRHALLTLEQGGAKPREYLRRRLNLTFDHQREVAGVRSNLPTRIEQSWFDRQAYFRDATAHRDDLGGFTQRACEWLVGESLSTTQLRALLGRMTRPDYPKLVELVLTELADRRSSGFGSLAIHKLLLPAQLDALAAAQPALRENPHFVEVSLARLRPGPDVALDDDVDARLAWLDALERFAATLVPAFANLQALVLYHRLDFDRRRGVYERERFERYLALPRSASYLSDAFRRRHKQALANLGQDFAGTLGLASVGDDEPLVRDYLMHSFAQVELDGYESLRSLIDEDYLRRVFAETKIVAGQGDGERWYSMLDDADYYKQLEQRVDIELAVQNRPFYAADDAVELLVDIKNVQALVVKVFEIDPLAFFLAHGRAVDTSVDLDGLVANEERTIEYAEPALRRVRRSFAFDSLRGGGTWVIELIGKGKSSRAVIRKGALRYVERLGAAGHVLTIVDEDDCLVPDASVWFAGREYLPNEHGEIRIPFGSSETRTSMLLRAGKLASVVPFVLRAEHYQLDVGFHVEREQLIAGAMAELVVRATLSVQGFPIPISLLRETTLTTRSTDRQGTSSTLAVPLALADASDTIHAFKVPEGLLELAFELRGKVRSLAEQRDVEFVRTDVQRLNEIELGQELAALHLAPSAAGWVLQLLGKTGEPRPDMQVNVILEHLDFTGRRQTSVQTDARGRIELGELREIKAIEASFAGGSTGRWPLERSEASLPARIHTTCDRPIVIPQPHALAAEPRAAASLLERRAGGFVRDLGDALHVEPGALRIAPLAPGDYLLTFKHDDTRVEISVGPATRVAGHALSRRRHLELSRSLPPRLATLELDAATLRIRVAGAGEHTRVHVFGSRYWGGEARSKLDHRAPRGLQTITVGRGRSHYLSGRDIGDEYRYILERRRAKRWAGNLAERPSLLLNPWATRTTSTGIASAASGGAYATMAEEAMRSALARPPAPKPSAQAASSSTCLDFLAKPGFVALALVPDAEGCVTIDRAAFSHVNLLQVVVVDPAGVVARGLRLPEVELPPRDLRLLDALPHEGHAIQRKQATALAVGDELAIDDLRTAKLEPVDTLSKAHALLLTLSGDDWLREFEFVTRWPKLSPEQQRERYSKYACHELHLFLQRKDPAFFAAVVRPYLVHKRDKTFLDHYLLGDDLARFHEPWAFGRLNVVERILLLGGNAARHLRDRVELIPPDVEGDNAAFDTVLAGSALAGEGPEGYAMPPAEASPADGFGMARGGGGPIGGARMPTMAPGAPPPPASAPAPAPAPARMRSAAAPAKRAAKMAEREEKEMLYEADDEAPMAEMADFDEGMLRDDLAAREQSRRFYQTLDKTQEWAENNWYRRRISEQVASLIEPNAFWRDYAEHLATTPSRPFASRSFVRATASFAEMMCVLAVLDLPFESSPPTRTLERARLRLCATSPVLVFAKQIAAVEPEAQGIGVLVNQSYFRADDRYRYENGETYEKYVGDELLVHVVYVCRVVLTNPSASWHKLDLLVQIPRGALPVGGAMVTRDHHVRLAPHATHALEYSFYFPAAGEFEHFPVHVARNEQLVAFAQPSVLHVVASATLIDTESWSHVSQHAEDAELLAYLDAHNLERLDLARIAWRMREREFFTTCVAKLAQRHVYHDALWSYALHHYGAKPTPELAAALASYLRHQDSLLRHAGLALRAGIVDSDPVERHWYEHLEYAPLVNARAHQLGAKRKILNDALAEQYRSFLTTLLFERTPSADQLVAAAGYAIVQDRIDDALALLERTDLAGVTGQLQLDYLRAWLAIGLERPDEARALAERHREHPVDRWRKRFANLLAILDEARGSAAQVVDADDRTQEQGKLASSEPSLDLEVEGGTITIHHQNLRECTLRFYKMDIELLFSRQPFMQDQSSRFSIVQPNLAQRVELAADRSTSVVELPAEYRSTNTILELVGAGLRRSKVNYAHDLALRVIEQYGQVRVSVRSSQTPLARAYVKVYARMQNGAVEFYKDGYTDLRGAFDYASLSTDMLDRVQRFAILVMSDDRGALIREAAPPQR